MFSMYLYYPLFKRIYHLNPIGFIKKTTIRICCAFSMHMKLSLSRLATSQRRAESRSFPTVSRITGFKTLVFWRNTIFCSGCYYPTYRWGYIDKDDMLYHRRWV